jgi:hypothetical protein
LAQFAFFYPYVKTNNSFQLFSPPPSINLVFGLSIEDLISSEEEFDYIGEEYNDEIAF